MFIDLGYAQQFFNGIQKELNASSKITKVQEPSSVLHEVQNTQQIPRSNKTPTNRQNIEQTALLNGAASVKKPAILETRKVQYPQPNTDMGFEVPEDEDFNVHLLEGFTKQESSDEHAAESGDDAEEEDDFDEGQSNKKQRE